MSNERSGRNSRLAAAPAAVLALVLVPAPGAAAAVKLPAIFGNHMVLQRDSQVPIWGWAEAGEKVSVRIAGQSKTATADASGKWALQLASMKAGGHHTLTVQGSNTIEIRDVLVGEVWLGSGQSNMALTVERAADFEKEKAAAEFPEIRMFTVARRPAAEPQADCEGEWKVCSAATVGAFSAAAYFFGREIHRSLGVPVGLIHSSVGGTAVEAWTSWEAQKELPELKPILEPWANQVATYDPQEALERYERQKSTWKAAAKSAKAAGKSAPRSPRAPVDPRLDNNHPANLFNGMIQPLIPYALRGAIWYQGERNARGENAKLYRRQLPLLIEDWRARWDRGKFPFLWVQLPNFGKPSSNPGDASDWAMMRESMALSLAVPNTGMAITIDIGEAGNIHPKNKQEVGRRLALWALAEFYGRKFPASGPLLRSQTVRENRIELGFAHTEGRLIAKGGPLRGFAVAGADRQWRWADAVIDGDRVIVSHPDVPKPAAVRYGWADNPDCNLYNVAGLPASPFRTDDWD